VKKKLVFIGFSFFLLVFLLWPASGYSDSPLVASCDDTGPLLQGSENRDCAPAHVPKIGGGFRYIKFVLQGQAPDPASDYNHYVFLENGDNFQPQKDLIISVIAGSAAGLLAVFILNRARK
jgi:hypothetical protein